MAPAPASLKGGHSSAQRGKTARGLTSNEFAQSSVNHGGLFGYARIFLGLLKKFSVQVEGGSSSTHMHQYRSLMHTGRRNSAPGYGH